MGNIIIFAIVGYILYLVFKSYARYTSYSKQAFKNFSVSYESLAKSDLGLFVALTAKVAKADGKIDKLEAQLISLLFDDISAVFPEPQKTRAILKEIFDKEKERKDDVQRVALALGNAIKRDKAKQHQFMGFLIQLAFVDGSVSEKEDKLLQTIAEAFEFDPAAYHAIFEKFEQMIKNIKPQANIDDAYKLLGVNKDDDMSVIKKAYRKLIRKYHPDIIKSQGKSEKYIQEATAKTQEINQAYEMIKEFKK